MADRVAVSWFPEASDEDWPADIVRLANRQSAEVGFVPNLLRAYVWRPDRLRAWYAHYRQLQEVDNDLTLVEREMIAVVVSAANRCEYCLTSHGAALRLLLGDPVLADQIEQDHRRAGLDARRVAILDFARALTTDPTSCDAAALKELEQLGLSDFAIWDVIEVASMFNFTNRLTMAAGIVTDEEYRTIGR